jgi:hypothetical protein
MNFSTTKSLYSFLAVLFLLIIITIILKSNLKSTYEENLKEFTILKQDSKEFDYSKKHWSVDSSNIDFDELKNHPKLINHEKRGDKYYFEFGNLSSFEFDIISNKILNSTMIIKKLSLSKNENSKGNIIVEFES